MSRFRGAWQSLNFYKECLFGFETLVFATSGILSMQLDVLELCVWALSYWDPATVQALPGVDPSCCPLPVMVSTKCAHAMQRLFCYVEIKL